MSCAVSTLGFGLELALSGPLAAWSSDDPAVQQLALDYLIPASAMVLPYSVAFAIAVGLRSVGRPGLATGAAVIGLASNVVLNYALIFGRLGAPALGVRGAAYALGPVLRHRGRRGGRLRRPALRAAPVLARAPWAPT